MGSVEKNVRLAKAYQRWQKAITGRKDAEREYEIAFELYKEARADAYRDRVKEVRETYAKDLKDAGRNPQI